MKLPAISLTAILALYSLKKTSAVLTADCETTPFVLDSGKSVCYTPESGGVIQISFPCSGSSGGTLVIQDGLESAASVEHQDGQDDDGGDDTFDPALVGNEMEVDLSRLLVDPETGESGLTKDSITVDLGLATGPMTFIREEHAGTTASFGGVDDDMDGLGDRRRLSMGNNGRRKWRRIQEIRMDALSDLVDDPNAVNQDYFPPNDVFGDGDPTQKFEYFEGKASIPSSDGETATEGTMTMRSIIHPTLIDENGNPKKVYVGIIVTDRYEYHFRGDPVTGKTLVGQYDPSEYPGMPNPVDPLDGDEHESYDEAMGGRRLNEEERKNLMEEREFVEREVKEAEERRRRKLQNDASDSGRSLKDFGLANQDGNVIDLGNGMRGRVNRRTQSDDGSVLDIMVAYTLNALCRANNQAYPCDDIDPAQHINIISQAELAVANTNQAYINSDIYTQLRLVYVHYTKGINDSSYTCGGILGAVTRKGDGVMDEVHDKRDEWGADFVALLTGHAVSGCGGIAWLGPYSSYTFSVTLQGYAPGGTFAHEVGHNYGCEHDRLNANPGKPYQYGWQDPDAEFRTIMAYNCPNGWCKRINYFSNPTKRYNGKIMGNAVNDCARRHNDVRVAIAKYRSVRVTNAPTISHAPTVSQAPSSAPSSIPSGTPTKSDVPSAAPTTSIAPTGAPSEYPTFSIADLAEFDQLYSPGTTRFQIQHGIMFDIEAKDVDVTIRNFRIPFFKPGNVTVSIWSKEGSFWYEKNNPAAWTLLGSPLAYSPGITLESPVSLPLRGGTEYGFEPIVIPAGTKKGIYITVNETVAGVNLIGMDKKELTTCQTESAEPFDFPIWFENNDIAVYEGVYKDYWKTSVGTAGSGVASFRFIGSIIYKSERTSAAPSGVPSLSLAPSLSLVPTGSDVDPSSYGYSEVSSGIGLQFTAVDGLMFEISAIAENVIIESLKLTILSLDPELNFQPADLFVYSIDGSFYDEDVGDAVDQSGWVQRGTTQVYASPTLDPVIIPANSFDPIFVKKGSTVGIYITIADSLRNHKILAYSGVAIKNNDFADANIQVREGLAKQWDPCLNWGDSLTNLDGTPTPHALYGSLLYTTAGTSEPTFLPSLMPSIPPSVSLVPSKSSMPSASPTLSAFPTLTPSLQPSLSITPTGHPTSSAAPSYARETLQTRTTDEGGNDGYGVMFDIVANRPVEIHNIYLSGMQSYPMNIKIFTRSGSHYDAYDDISKWEVIQSYTNFTADINGGRLSFPPQFIGVEQTRAFYIAIVETYGEIWPLLGGLLPGINYRDGIWANDTAINLMEGLKFFGISEEKPMGIGTTDSGVYLLEGPGGTSYNMKDARIEYSLADTIMPSTEPTTSVPPTISIAPSLGPTSSMSPSSSPSVSSMPSGSPSSIPSVSSEPSSIPSVSPSSQPSVSAMPSMEPSESSMPTSTPSKSPSSKPSAAPSDAPSVSSMPSSVPTSVPSASPSVSFEPSASPTMSLMPTQSREFLNSATPGTLSGSFGVLFEVTAKRSILIQTFAVKHYGGNGFNFHVFTKSGSIGSSYSDASAWKKLGQVSYGTLSSTQDNPVTLPSQNLSPVMLNAGETQSFYIACVGNYFRVHEESAGTVVENSDASIAAGLNKYPYDTLFHSSTQGLGSTKYMFQGKLIYSYGVEPPSASPSDVPSVVPSISTEPTFISKAPSNVPSLSVKPTGAPIDPTAQPTISTAPTVDPYKEATIQISIPSQLVLSGFQIPTSQVKIKTVLTLLANTIKARASVKLNSNQRVKSVKILSINGVPFNGSSSRRLQDSALIEYEIILEEICSTSKCDDSQTVANTLYQSVTQEMRASIDDGSLTTAIVQSAQAAGADADALLAAAVESGDFGEVVTTIIGLLGDFYPDWLGGGYCLNDGNEPNYMKLNPSLWVYSTRSACCTRYYPYAYNDCMGSDAVPSGKYYPDWDQNQESRCLSDGQEPDYMASNPTAWMYDSAEECCTRYYSWDLGACVKNSGGTAVESATRKWYVLDGEEKCVQDCEVNVSEPTCGGLANPWDSLFATSSDCCSQKVSWVSLNVCDATSQGQTPTGSSKWYVDWDNMKCVMDCEGNSSCGGLAEPHNALHVNKATCCSTQLSWDTDCLSK